MGKRLRAAVVTVATVLGVMGAVTAPAQAASGWERCPRGELCLFSGDSGTGGLDCVYFGSAGGGIGTHGDYAEADNGDILL